MDYVLCLSPEAGLTHGNGSFTSGLIDWLMDCC